MEKMSIKESAAVRVELYDIITSALANSGYSTEAIKSGTLIHLPDGYFAKLSVSVCDASKFDLEATRAEFAETVENRKKRAEEAKIKAAEKEAKAAEKAAKAAEKAAAKAAKETE